MLRATFLHLTGVGSVGEAAFWRNGITDWAGVTEATHVPNLSSVRRERILAELRASEEALRERNVSWFAQRLPPSEVWRTYPTFRQETAFLDIETTSLSPYEGIVTVVSVHGGGQTRTFVADDNLEELPAYLRRFPILVTFNGSLFDVPFLQVRFPQLARPTAHIDLRFVLYRLGIAGGLKRIEARLGLGDRTGVEGIAGLEAVRLWEQYRRGNAGALERLIRYNRADTVNLEPLVEFAVRELRARLLGPEVSERLPTAQTLPLG